MMQNRWLFFLIGLVSLVVLIYKREIARLWFNPAIIIPVSICLWIILAYSMGGEFAMRYGLVAIALFYVVILGISREALKILVPEYHQLALLAVCLAGVLANVMVWRPKPIPAATFDFRPPMDLSYADMIDVFRQLGFYTQIENGNSHWFGAFPENLYLTQNYLEYVPQSAEFSFCSEFKADPKIRQLIIYHPYSPGQLECQNLLQTTTVKPYRRLAKGDKWLQIYEVTASGSAKTLP